MLDQIRQIILQENCILRESTQIRTVTVPSVNIGIDLTKKLLGEILSRKSALYLSGGRTPKELYGELAREEKITPGIVGLVDERYGVPFHENSNELMLRESGILRYFQMRDIPFVPILSSRHSGEERNDDSRIEMNRSWISQDDKKRAILTEQYDQKLRELFATYQKHIAILGIGTDGHTAGIPADPAVWEEYHIAGRSKTEMVIDFDDQGPSAGSGFYGQRITMSYLALSMMDVLLVLVFGKDKKRPLEWMMADGPEEEVPSRFFKRSDIAPKTLLITDQEL